MLTLFSGPFSDMTPAEQDAVNDLTLQRYLESMHLTPETGLHGDAYDFYCEAFRRELNRIDGNTFICAVFLESSDGPTPLGAMRTLKGSRSDVRLSSSVGQACSSVPSHTLLKNFAYPVRSDFDADQLSESDVLECSRLAIASRTQLKGVIAAGLMKPEEVLAVRPRLLDELIVHSYRRAMNGSHRCAGWLFNVKPRLAGTLHTKGLDLLPLFGDGVEPVDEALAPDAFSALYFSTWRSELRKVIPDVDQLGIHSAIRQLVQHDPAALRACEISLPFLLVCNGHLESAIQELETKLCHSAGCRIERRVHDDRRDHRGLELVRPGVRPDGGEQPGIPGLDPAV
jgi:hypothetical protein